MITQGPMWMSELMRLGADTQQVDAGKQGLPDPAHNLSQALEDALKTAAETLVRAMVDKV